MKAVMLAFCLVLGTLVAGAPVVERRHVKPKFTSILVFGDSFMLDFRVPVSYSRTNIVFVGIRYKHLRVHDERSESLYT